MSGISSDLICRVIGGYRFSSEDADYRRYLNLNSLMELLGISDEEPGAPAPGSVDKVAAYVPEDDSGEYSTYQDVGEERGQQVEKGYDDRGPEKYETGPRQRSVSEGYVPPEVQQGINQMFIKMIRPYFPGGYFQRDDSAKRISDEFFQRAYKRFNQLLRMDVAEKLKKYNIPETGINFTPDMMYEIIMDALQYMNEHPADIKEGLIRAYTGDSEEEVEPEDSDESTFEDFSEIEKEIAEEEGKKKKEDYKKELGEAQAFFVPRFDEGAFKERIDKGDKVKSDDVDPDVVDNLKGRHEVKWDWKDVDEHKILHFTLPELYGDREFTVKLPAGIRDIDPGQYTFRIKSVREGKGAVIEFLEQKVGLHQDKLDMIRAPRRGGLGPDQLKKFIDNGIINKYRAYLKRMPLGKFIEKYKGEFSIGGDQINSVSDLDELSGLGEQSFVLSKGRGYEEVKKKREESRAALLAKIDAVKERWIPEISRQILKVPEAEGSKITKLISSKFPPSSTKTAPSLLSIMSTQPVIENVLSHIMSPTTPLTGGGRGGPWMHFAMEDFGEMALKEPSIRGEVEKMIRTKRGDKLPNQPVSDKEIEVFLQSQKNSIVKRFSDVVKEIGRVIEENKGAPELQKFFDRRRVFRMYSGKILGDEIADYMEENGLSLSRPEDMKKIEKYIKKRLNQLIVSLERGKPFKRKKEQDKADQVREEYKRKQEQLQQETEQPRVIQREQRGTPQTAPAPVQKDAMQMLVHRVMQRLSR